MSLMLSGCVKLVVLGVTLVTVHLFVDEIYGNLARYFWQKVKIFSQILDVMILFLGMYHPTLVDNPTPAEFAHALGLNDTLVMNFVQKYNMQRL